MFLATTALTQFWDKDQEILFLGSWCTPYDRSSEWKSLKHSILPSPWDDRERFYAATRYLDKTYESLLGQLAEYLNSVHGTSLTHRYWRLLIGPWLMHYLHSVYDRYVLLTDAFSKYPQLQTVTMDPGSFQVPQDTRDFIDLVNGDSYNLQLFSLLLTGLKFDFPSAPLRDESGANGLAPNHRFETRPNILRSIRRKGVRFVESGISLSLGRMRQVALHDMSMPRAQIWNLIRTSGLRAGPIAVQNKWFFDMPEPEFDQRRNELAALTASDEFESNFFRTLPQNLPTIYLEGFNQAQCETLRNYKEYPPVLCSATGWLFNEQFKFFAAESEEKGSRLVAVQHGGGDGEYRFAPIELHMCRLSETFMVWGWKDQDEAALKNLPSPRISSFISDCSETWRQQKEGPVLFIATSHLRYLYRFHSCPVGGQLEDYWDWQLRFLASAPAKLRKVVLYRAYHTDYGWCARQRISDRFPEVQSDDSPSIDQRIRESRLIVIDHLSTSLLESFTANVPTVLYWNPARWEVREEAEADFQKLRDAGILWDSPEEAASHVSAVFDEPWEWWGQEAVQSARSSFLEGHGLGRKDWTRHWVKSLEAEFALSQGPQSAGA